MLTQRIRLILAFAALGTASGACDEPCLALTRSLCFCERSELEQQACVRRVEAVAITAPTEAEENCCIRLQETCNCDDLADGNLAACGITQETEDTAPLRECLVADSIEPVDPG